MSALLDSADGRSLFVGGGARNQSKFYDRLDANHPFDEAVADLIAIASQQATSDRH